MGKEKTQAHILAGAGAGRPRRETAAVCLWVGGSVCL